MRSSTWLVDCCISYCLTCKQVWSVSGPPCIAPAQPLQTGAQPDPLVQPGESTSGCETLLHWPSTSETWRRKKTLMSLHNISTAALLCDAGFTHLESQAPPRTQVLSWVRVRLNWASSLTESWISLFLSFRLILQRFRYSSITSCSSHTLCWGWKL